MYVFTEKYVFFWEVIENRGLHSLFSRALQACFLKTLDIATPGGLA
jgi:hypothetical protein